MLFRARWETASCRDYFTMFVIGVKSTLIQFVIGVKSTLIQLQTNEVGIASG